MLSCTPARVRLLSRVLMLIIVSIVSLSMGHLQQLDAQTVGKPSSVAQPSTNWQRYTPKGEEFSVLFPTVPAMNTSNVTRWNNFFNARQRLKTLIGAYSEGVVYAIEIFEVKQSLDEFISESRNPSGGVVREVSVSNLRGKELTFENNAGKRVVRYFKRGSRIYVFKAHGSRLGNPDVGIPRFLESIKFDRPLGGLAIVDGVGVQESTELTPVANGKDAIFSSKDVDIKNVVVMKPEPSYTEEARQNEITGTVVLRCVFTSSGAVANLRVVAGLPNGLTEKAVAVAPRIRFIPAIKDGRFVSTYVQLEYAFNLY